MIRSLIVDDEKPVRDSFVNMLHDYFPQVQIAAVCENVPQAIEAAKNLRPELVFLDVEMPPQTGFDFLEQTREIPFEVIFTTSFNQYAIQAIKFSALDYLLKPFGIEDLQLALERYHEKQHKQNTTAQIDMLIKQIKSSAHEPPKTIAVPTLNGLTFIKVDDIVRCESDNNYTTIYLTNKNKILVSRSLKEYDDMLVDCNFFRIHAKHLINLSHIKNYTRGEGGIVTMNDGSEVDVARRRKEEFLLKIGPH